MTKRGVPRHINYAYELRLLNFIRTLAAIGV